MRLDLMEQMRRRAETRQTIISQSLVKRLPSTLKHSRRMEFLKQGGLTSHGKAFLLRDEWRRGVGPSESRLCVAATRRLALRQCKSV